MRSLIESGVVVPGKRRRLPPKADLPDASDGSDDLGSLKAASEADAGYDSVGDSDISEEAVKAAAGGRESRGLA